MPISILKVKPEFLQPLRVDLLLWYHQAKRVLPWRAQEGQQANPYYVMLSEFMLQQTTVLSVIPFFNRFIERYPTLQALSNAEMDDIYVLWQGLGYYSRAKNLYYAAQKISAMSEFPKDVEILRTIPGIGDYTSAAIAAIAFDAPVLPVDGNVMRVFSRLFMLKSPKGPVLQKEVKNYLHYFSAQEDNQYVAQALMDLGALICKPKTPLCTQCPLQNSCKAYQTASQSLFPYTLKKPVIEQHTGLCFIVETQDKQILLLRRPNKGLFANMYILPTTHFGFDFALYPQLRVEKEHETVVDHAFTHFKLKLEVITASVHRPFEIENGIWVHKDDLHRYSVPTIMKKVLDVGYTQFG